MADGERGGGGGRAAAKASGEGGVMGPERVTFPAVVRWNQGFPAPLKLEVEESAEDMSPRNMWQVYALGGFMILRWAWARWSERKDRGRPPDDSTV